jgi:hypothetical protein
MELIKHMNSFRNKMGLVRLDEAPNRKKRFVVSWEFTNEPQEFESFKREKDAVILFQDKCAIIMNRSEVF